MSAPKQEGRPVKFLTEKPPTFVTHFADGAWAMVNGSGNIQLNFYIERPQLPTAVTYHLDEKGAPIGTTGPSSFEGIASEGLHIVREYQSAVVMTLPTARQLASVLANFISMGEAIQKGAVNE